MYDINKSLPESQVTVNKFHLIIECLNNSCFLSVYKTNSISLLVFES